jgi:hypothetical protein
MSQNNRVNKAIGQGVGIAGFPAIQWVVFGFVIVCLLPFFMKNPIGTILAGGAIITIWLLLSGKDPTIFLESLRKKQKWVVREVEVRFNRAGIPKPATCEKSRRIKLKGKPATIWFIEPKYNLLTYGQIELGGHEVGYYLLQLGPQLMIIFGWVCEGYDPAITDEQAKALIQRMNKGLVGLPLNVDLKGYNELFCSADEYCEAQDRTKEGLSLTPLEKALIGYRQKNAIEMAKSGNLLENKLYVFAKYRVPLGTSVEYKRNNIEKFFSDFGPTLGLGETETTVDKWGETIQLAYDNCWKNVQTILTSVKGFGMKVETQTGQQLWERDWYEVHTEPAPKVPQLLLYDILGLHEPILNDWIHSLGVLFSEERGCPTLPDCGDTLIYLPAKDLYAAFVRMGQPDSIPAHEDSNALGIIRYLHNGVSSSYDYKVVWEITRRDPLPERINLDRRISSSTKRIEHAIGKGTRDVTAEIDLREAVEAREKIEEGHPPCLVSVGIWLYRKDIQTLNADISKLVLALSSSRSTRAQFSTQDHYLQTWPFEWQLFMSKPYARCFDLLSDQAIACLPLIKPRKLDESGILFTHRELRTPVCLDIVNVIPNHTAVGGTTKAGKTVLASELFLEPIIAGIPAMAFDLSSDSGESTYKPLVNSLRDCGKNAVYYSIEEHIINVVEIGNLSNFHGKEYRKRFNSALKDQRQLLSILVLGAEFNALDERDIDLALARVLRAFHYDPERPELSSKEIHYDPSIAERRAVATAAGWGNPDYEKMPILEDFVDFAKGWFNDRLADENDSLNVAIVDKIMSRLKGVLDTSLGQSLNGLSSFSLDTDIIVVGLNDTTNDTEALVYATVGLNILLRKGVQCKAFTLLVEEGTSLFRLKRFASRIAALPPTARKLGGNCIFLFQTIKPIYDSGYGNAIFGNMSNILMGFSTDEIVQEMTRPQTGMRLSIAEKYTDTLYQANPELAESYWYLKRGQLHMELTYHPSDLHLAIVSSQPVETAARARFKAMYGNPSDPSDIRWLLKYAPIFAHCKREGIPMSQICAEEVELRSAA